MTKAEWKSFRGSQNTPDHIMLSINGNPAHTMTVTWRTDIHIESGYALYRKKGSDAEWMRADAAVTQFCTDMDESRYFFADMCGLEAQTHYEYTVGDDTYRSTVIDFKTARESFDKFSFLCVSDVQTGDAEPPADYTQFGETLKKALGEHPEAEFILTAGDNTNCGGTDIQWTGLMDGIKDTVCRIPFMMSLGNHDGFQFKNYYTKEGKFYPDLPEYFYNQFRYSYPQNGPDGYKTVNYAFDYGNAHFSVLGVSAYEQMNEWLIDDIAKNGKTWNFGVHHFPVCYSSPALENEDTYPALRDGLEKCDVFFSGHEHSFARSYPRRKDGLYDKPSQGTVHYNMASGNRNPPGCRSVQKVWNAVTYRHEEELSTFYVVDIDGAKATFTAFVEDGRIFDQCTIDKANDVIYPRACAPVFNKPRLTFKGYDLGLCNERTLPVKVDGVWYIAPGALVSFLGGTVERTAGKIRVEVFGHDVTFRENSNMILTESGEKTMALPCLRLAKEQLFASLDDVCAALGMHPFCFEHNNFITLETPDEDRPVPVQP